MSFWAVQVFALSTVGINVVHGLGPVPSICLFVVGSARWAVARVGIVECAQAFKEAAPGVPCPIGDKKRHQHTNN